MSKRAVLPRTLPGIVGRRRRLFIRSRRWIVRLGFWVGRQLPLQRRVVLATGHDRALRGNLAAIHDGLLARDPAIPPVVVTARGGGQILPAIRAAVADAVAGYRLARSRLFVVDDYYFPIYVITPRAGTTIVQTWHAAGALKKFGYSVLDKSFGADDTLLGLVTIHANYTVCLVSSMAVAPWYAEAFGVPLDSRFRSDIGLPRTDVLLDPARRAAVVDTVRTMYRIPPDRRVILYAPTFRGDSIRRATADGLLDLARLQALLGDDHVLLLRLHPFVRRSMPIPSGLASFVIDVSSHPEMNDLLPAADLLITDYSSVIYEFALLHRPIVFYAPDLDHYETERGFYIDYQAEVPGPVCRTTEAVAAVIRDGHLDAARVVETARIAFDAADGHATERFIDRIVVPALAGRAPSGPPGDRAV